MYSVRSGPSALGAQRNAAYSRPYLHPLLASLSTLITLSLLTTIYHMSLPILIDSTGLELHR
jgi:hypothetical protein